MGRALASETFLRIIVVNEEEDGTVELDLLQPEVGTPLTAMVTDPDGIADGATITWEWSVSKVTGPDPDTEDHWTVITGDTDNMFTPRGVRAAAIDPRPSEDPANPIDEGEFVRAKASYTDGQGEDKETIGVSVYAVRAEVDSITDAGVVDATNDSPGFRQGLDYTRSVPENTAVEMNVGAPVTALDPNNDILSYSLVAIGSDGDANFTDVDFFNIDRASGQISLVKMLDFEEEDGRFDGTPDPTAGQYRVTVMATDPSGETADVTVTITATVSNDAPVIRGKEELRVMEQDSDDRDGDDTPDKTYTGAPNMLVNQAADEDTANPNVDNSNVYRASDDDARGDITWSIKSSSTDPEAEDGALFELSSADLTGEDEPRALRFRTPPDFENPQDANRDNVYKVTLIANDRSPGGTDEHRISIFVMNEHEQGDAMLTASGDDPTQPVIGEAITAMVSDPDGGIAIVTWQWQRAGEKTGPWAPIPGATYATYTPQPNIPGAEEDDDQTFDVDETEPTVLDQGMFLRAVATYIDTTSDADDPDTMGIDERVQSAANTAKDPTMGDGDDVTSTGEATDSAVTVYRVMATTEKAVRAPDTGDPTTDPTVDPDPPTFDPGSYTGTVAENSEVGSLVTMSAMVDAGDAGEDHQGLMLLTADSEDNQYFTIDEYGQIRVGEVEFDAANLPIGVQDVDTDDTAPAMQDPDLDFETRTTYRLIVSAENDGGKSTANVTISLTDRNEHPYFDKQTREIDSDTTADGFDRTISYSEGSTSRNVQLLAAVEPDGDSLRWEVIGTDSADFEIIDAPDGPDGKDRRQLRWRSGSQPDFEDPKDRLLDVNLNGTVDDGDGDDAAGNNMYKITVRITEASTVGAGVEPRAAELDLTISVTDAEESGMVHFNLRQPEVGTEITASVTDLDAVNPAATPPNVDGTLTPTGWLWFKAKNNDPDPNVTEIPDAGNNDWEPITGATSAAYTPVGAPPDDPDTPNVDENADGTAIDEGFKLLVRATYTTDVPPGTASVTAIGITEFSVKKSIHDESNNSPGFPTGDAMRTVREDIAVGDPVGAPVRVILNEDDDVLTYSMLTTTTENSDVMELHVPFFYVDNHDGQIRVKQPLDFEVHDLDTTPNLVEPAEYQIVIRATDPSGEGPIAPSTDREDQDDITVIITVTDVNEAPKVTAGKSIIQVDEADSNKDIADGADYYIGLGNERDTTDTAVVNEEANTENYYRKSDEDPVDSHTWTLVGPDGALFEYSTPTDGISRRLHFKAPPDYEDPKDQNRDNVYEVWVRATDNRGVSGHKVVRVEVMNVDEEGTLTLMPAEPVEATAGDGVEIMATLTDPDGEVVITDWNWVAATGRLTDFPDDDTTPEDRIIDAVDQGHTVYKYTGEAGEFVWAKVSYRDGASVVDDPVTALDERNDNPGTDATEQHKLQNLTDADPPVLETGDNLHHNSDEMLTKVTDTAVQAPHTEPGTGPGDETTDPTGPPSVIEIERTVPENTPSTGYVGMPLTADEMPGPMTGPDAPVFVFAEDVDENQNYYDDELSPSPDIEDDKTGQLAIALTAATEPMTHLDYEAIKNSYVVEFSDDTDPNSDIYRLTILVTNVNEAPSMPEEATGGLRITGPFNVSRYNEMHRDMVATYNTTGEAPGATVTWDLSGDDANDFSISNSGELTFRSVPDFENPVDMNMDNIYSITVEAMDDATPNANVDTQFVTVTVGNVNEEGMLTVSSERPAVDRMITAMLEDDDGIVGSVTWTWSMSDMLDGTYTAISGADEAMYTVMESDVDMFLQVKAEYEDGHGRGKSEMKNFRYAVTMSLVFPSDMIDIEVDENTAGGTEIGMPVAASGGQADTVMHAITGGADMAAFTIDAMSGQVSTATATMLDYEAKDEYTFEVTATGTAADQSTETAMTTVTVMVMNVNEEGRVTFWRNSADATTAEIMVGDMLTGLAEDPDGNVGDMPADITGMYTQIMGMDSNITWLWAKSMDMTTWMNIAGATDAAYTVMDTDEDYYLRATAMYDDAEGRNKEASEMTAYKVGEMSTTGNANADLYDTNPQDGMIDGEEALDAVVDYFDGSITSEQLLDVLVVYFG